MEFELLLSCVPALGRGYEKHSASFIEQVGEIDISVALHLCGVGLEAEQVLVGQVGVTVFIRFVEIVGVRRFIDLVAQKDRVLWDLVGDLVGDGVAEEGVEQQDAIDKTGEGVDALADLAVIEGDVVGERCGVFHQIGTDLPKLSNAILALCRACIC